MKIRNLILGVASMFLFASAFSAEKAKKVTPEQAKAMLKEKPSIILVDVRTNGEYAAAHIPGAILLPNESIGKQPPKALPDMNAEIVVYCRSGMRSADAARKLIKLGYKNVFDLGGIMSWPYETVSGME